MNNFDLGGVVLLEHINLDITSRDHCHNFYIALGGTPDRDINTRMNFGLQQFHLGLREVPQIIDGHVGILLPNLDNLTQRLIEVTPKLEGTKFSWSKKDKNDDPDIYPGVYTGTVIHVDCPFGNHFRVYEYSKEFGMNTKIGILYVYSNCPIDSTKYISKFFQEVYHSNSIFAQSKRNEDNSQTENDNNNNILSVKAGAWQHLYFRETTKLLPEYSDYHICFYISDFSGSYQRSLEGNNLFTNHRFLDKCSTFQEACESSQFRNLSIKDNELKEVYKLHQEVRSVLHPAYSQILNNDEQ